MSNLRVKSLLNANPSIAITPNCNVTAPAISLVLELYYAFSIRALLGGRMQLNPANGSHHRNLLSLEVFQSLLCTRATKMYFVLVFCQLREYGVDVWNP